MKNLTLENITRVCRGTYHGDPAKLGQEEILRGSAAAPITEILQSLARKSPV